RLLSHDHHGAPAPDHDVHELHHDCAPADNLHDDVHVDHHDDAAQHHHDDLDEHHDDDRSAGHHHDHDRAEQHHHDVDEQHHHDDARRVLPVRLLLHHGRRLLLE